MSYMFSVYSIPLVLLLSGFSPAVLQSHPASKKTELRVCADPNNMPFSNDREQGFENEMAQLVAHELGRTVHYVWWPQRRGFIRNTLDGQLCDVVMGVPSDYELALTTHPYYRSSYVWVVRHDRGLRLSSLRDKKLDRLRIGLHAIGDDYSNVPPAQVLAERGLARNIVGYSIYGDYSQQDPPARLIDAVVRGDVDVAIAWGPLAGYFAQHAPVRLDVNPVSNAGIGHAPPLTFAISMAVRRGDNALKSLLDRVLTHRQSDIRSILQRYGVPLVEG